MMPVPRRRLTYQPYSVAVRVVVVILGVAAIVWGASALPGAWRSSTLDYIADHVIAGDRFKPKALAEFLTLAETSNQQPLCNAAALRAAAIIDLRLLEADFEDGDGAAIDTRTDASRDSIRRALSCSPADSFLWLALYWVEINRDGFGSRDVEYLRMSYLLGPNEGWIALKRNGRVMAIFDQLPADLRDRAVTEFASLLNSGIEGELVAILTGPGWKARGHLLAKLRDVKEDYREDFAKALFHSGYDVVVPGIRLPEARPWN